MRVAMLSPIAWRTPPRHYGPWERITSLLTEELVKKGIEVTLFATADSVTRARLNSVCTIGYEENKNINVKVWESLHIANLFEHANEFDLIHNNFDFLPLTYSGLVETPILTTIHGFSSPSILPVYKKYNRRTFYVSISNSDRSPELDYIATIYHGIDITEFAFNSEHNDYLLFFGRIHNDKGIKDAIEIAKRSGRKLIIAGIIQDEQSYRRYVKPHLDGIKVEYIGSIGPEKRNSLLGNAFVLLHPINFEEPFGLSVVEAMACGTPVIAYSRGSMPEIITSGQDGFLVDNIEDAVSAVDQIHCIDRRCCRTTVEKRFTSDRMADEYIQIYEKISREK